jgi:hypothetical protein
LSDVESQADHDSLPPRQPKKSRNKKSSSSASNSLATKASNIAPKDSSELPRKRQKRGRPVTVIINLY